jgi:hypothetical protein
MTTGKWEIGWGGMTTGKREKQQITTEKRENGGKTTNDNGK